MSRLRLRFVSRLPELFSVGDEVKQAAWASGAWQDIGALRTGKTAAKYRLQSFERRIDGRLFRLIVVHSDHLDERKQRSLEKTLKREEERLAQALQKLEQRDFHCLSDAQQAIEVYRKEQRSDWYTWEMEIETLTRPAKRTGRGRPKKTEATPMETVYVPRRTMLLRNEEAVEEERHRLGTFVLISNAETDRVTDAEVLRTYKGQDAAETRFRLLKDPQLVDGIFLKTPDRSGALGIVLVMALLVYGILEYRVREQWAKQEKPFRIPGRSKDYKPTGQVLLALLQSVKVMLLQYSDRTERFLTDNADELACRVVEMAGYDMTIYTTNRVEAGIR